MIIGEDTTCLPEPLTPAKGFSWSRQTRSCVQAEKSRQTVLTSTRQMEDGSLRFLVATPTITGCVILTLDAQYFSNMIKDVVIGSSGNVFMIDSTGVMGYSGAEFDPEKVNVCFASAAGSIEVCCQGRGLAFDEDLAKKILTEHDIEINIQMGEGDAACTCWGCDITYDYIKINGDYRS